MLLSEMVWDNFLKIDRIFFTKEILLPFLGTGRNSRACPRKLFFRELLTNFCLGTKDIQSFSSFHQIQDE